VNKNIINRLKEPSTWAGLAVLALSFGLGADKVAALGHIVSAIAPFVPVDGGVLAQTIIAAAGGVAVVLPETKPAAKG
jgi:hypothetical protein